MDKKEKLTMITTFSGIGCQERGFIDSNLFDLDVIATSDIDKEAILSYAAIHCGLTDELVEKYQEYPSKYEMADELKAKNIGYDFVKNKAYDWDKLAKRSGMKIERYWLAMKLTNNVGDICKVEALPYCDILTFSFPCQSISVAGRQEGMVKGKTRSGLVYEIVRLIEKSKENSKFEFNEPLKKDKKNKLKTDSIVKCDQIYKIPFENIQFKIGQVDIDDYIRFMDAYNLALKKLEDNLQNV